MNKEKVYCKDCNNFNFGTGGELANPDYCATSEYKRNSVTGILYPDIQIHNHTNLNANNDCIFYEKKKIWWKKLLRRCG